VIPAAVARRALVVAFARNAPRAMPGQARYPRRRRAARAMPVDGHTAVTCSATNAIDKPTLAATK
jgi:hypothetical protein